MGYYTTFKGSVSGPEDSLRRFKEDAEKGLTFSDYDIEFSDFFDNYLRYGETMKWYSHEEDMIALSKKYPNVLFSLQGEGEEPGDIWKAWYRNGRSVTAKAQITFNEPDLDRVLPLDVELERKEADSHLARAEEALAEAQAILDRAKARVDRLNL